MTGWLQNEKDYWKKTPADLKILWKDQKDSERPRDILEDSENLRKSPDNSERLCKGPPSSILFLEAHAFNEKSKKLHQRPGAMAAKNSIHSTKIIRQLLVMSQFYILTFCSGSPHGPVFATAADVNQWKVEIKNKVKNLTQKRLFGLSSRCHSSCCQKLT